MGGRMKDKKIKRMFKKAYYTYILVRLIIVISLILLVLGCDYTLFEKVKEPAAGGILSDSKDITTFSFLASDNVALSEDVVATITGLDISATVPFGTDVTALVASFSTTGVFAKISDTTQISGVTENNFTDTVTYTVTAADETTQDYTVTVGFTLGIVSTSPSDGATSTNVDGSISVTFNKSMNTSSVTTNTSDENCSESLQLSSDNFSTCIQMSASPSASNSDKTFTIKPSSRLSFNTIYKFKITTDVEDTSGKNLPEEKIVGFTTEKEGNLDWIVQHDNAAGGNGGDSGLAITTDPNRKIIVGGFSVSVTDNDAAIWRYNSNGTLDNTFGLMGYVTHDSAAGGNGHDVIYDITTDSSGNIYAVGFSENSSNYFDAVIWKYDSNGNLDNSFGSNGIIVLSGDAGGTEDDFAYGITIDSNSKIFVTGYGRDPSNMLFNMIIWSFDLNGVPDEDFGNGGIVLFQSAQGLAITTDSNGKILVVGKGPISGEMLIWRYNPIGTLDNTFDSDGIVSYRPEPLGDAFAYGLDILVDSNGKILVSGYIENSMNDMAIWRYNSNGALDNTFSSDGLVTYDTVIGAGGAGCDTAITIDNNNGNILITGSSWDTSQFDMVLLRYAANGILDSSFGTNGIVRYDESIDSDKEGGQDIIIDSNGDILITGISKGEDDQDMTIWKYKASQ